MTIHFDRLPTWAEVWTYLLDHPLISVILALFALIVILRTVVGIVKLYTGVTNHFAYQRELRVKCDRLEADTHKIIEQELKLDQDQDKLHLEYDAHDKVPEAKKAIYEEALLRLLQRRERLSKKVKARQKQFNGDVLYLSLKYGQGSPRIRDVRSKVDSLEGKVQDLDEKIDAIRSMLLPP